MQGYDNLITLRYIYIYLSCCEQVYIEKKNIPMIALQIYKSIPMTALWCPAFSNHG